MNFCYVNGQTSQVGHRCCHCLFDASTLSIPALPLNKSSKLFCLEQVINLNVSDISNERTRAVSGQLVKDS